jgi:hypothetical protein
MPSPPDPRSGDHAGVATPGRWSVEQVEAVAPTPGVISVARPLASHARWQATACDARAVWGSYHGSGAEPYATAVDHVGVAFRCTCPSRRSPCKHAIALLLLWARGDVAPGVAPPEVAEWAARERSGHVPGARAATGPTDPSSPGTGALAGDGPASGEEPPPPPADDAERDAARDDRVARMYAGLVELDRWLDDRIRTGLADPALARYATWDELAARLVDARAGSLANRVRRLAGLVGASPDWHDRVLAELGMLHLLSQGGRRLGGLPDPLADAVATTVGWQVRRADVLAGVPETDEWVVCGRSDTREDRIEVRRHWLRGARSGRWALVLSFAAYRQSLDDSLTVGTAVVADLHRYPGPALRALVGERHAAPSGPARPPAHDVAAACAEIGAALVDEPWLDRVPTTVRASVVRSDGRWWLTDERGCLPVLDDGRRPADGGPALLLAVSEGRPVDVTVEWTPHGLVPLTAHLEGRGVDVGPRADTSFVSAA